MRHACIALIATSLTALPLGAVSQPKLLNAAQLLIDVCVPVVTKGKSIDELLPPESEPLDAKSASAFGMTSGGWTYGKKGAERVIVGMVGQRCVTMDFNKRSIAQTISLVEDVANAHEVKLTQVSSRSESKRYLVQTGLPSLLEVSSPGGIATIAAVYPVLEPVPLPMPK